jgi:hypothetical protein
LKPPAQRTTEPTQSPNQNPNQKREANKKTIRHFQKQGFGIVHYWSYFKSIIHYHSSIGLHTRLYEDLEEESQFVYFAPTTTTTA